VVFSCPLLLRLLISPLFPYTTLFRSGDIADEQLVHDIFSDYPITGVIHFAAESHVDRSIQDAKSFVTTNVLGTFTLLEAAKNAWEKQGRLAENRFHQISTD